MKVAIMQPYFFPYAGYWQLILSADVWVIFDDCQFSKKSWMTRNRILHPDPAKDFQYINIGINPVVFPTRVSDVEISSSEEWRNRIMDQLTVYEKLRAPFFKEAMQPISHVLFSSATTLAQQTSAMISTILPYLDISSPPKIMRSSEIEYDEESITHPGQWALEISKAVDADTYINPIGGQKLFRPEEFAQYGINLEFLSPELSEYEQAGRPFVQHLSILDMLMFRSPEKIRTELSRNKKFISGQQDQGPSQ